MPRGPEIVDFAGKLRLAMARANLSRAQFAQAAGVDKSVVARWLNGALAPSDHSLTMLTAALARTIEGFGRADWDLPSASLASRLGIAAAAAPAAEAAPGPAFPFPRIVAATAASLAHAEAVYCGLWVLVFPSPTDRGRIFPVAMRIRREPGAPHLEIEYLNRVMVDNHGPAFVYQNRLCGMFESRMRTNVGLFQFHGTALDQALVLDGMLASQSVSGRPFAVRALAFRLGGPADDAALDATIRRCGEIYTPDLESRLPAALVDVFRRTAEPGEGSNWLVLDRDMAWTMGATGRDDPACRDPWTALATMRGMFAGVPGVDPLP